MKNPFADLLDLIYPNLCFICGETLMKSESHICLTCLNNIPRTNYHLTPDNPVEKRFWGKVPIFRGTSFFFFQKGSPFQKLLHELKYKGNKEIGEIMGKYAAAELLNAPDFCSIDLIIPIPLHPKKLAKRGYNQSEWIGKGLSAVLNKQQDTNTLKRIRKLQRKQKNLFSKDLRIQQVFLSSQTPHILKANTFCLSMMYSLPAQRSRQPSTPYLAFQM